MNHSELFSKRKILSTQFHYPLLASEADDLPDSIRIVNPDSNEPFHCEAVAKDDGSVQYECSATIDEAGSNSSQSGTGAQNKPAKTKQHGKFSLNVSYVIQFNTIIRY